MQGQIRLKNDGRALRLVFSDYFSPYATLLRRSELSSLQNQRNAKICITVYKVLNTKQLLDKVEHDIMNHQSRGLCYLPKPKAEADNTDTRV